MLWLSIFELKNSKNDIFKIFGSVLHIQKYIINDSFETKVIN